MHIIYRTCVAVLVLLLTSPTVSYGQDLSTPKAILKANIEATGGDVWNEVKTMHTVTEMVMKMEMATVTMTMESWVIKPDYMVTKIKMLEGPPGMRDGAGNSTIYITPEEGWIDGFQGRMEISSLPAAQRDQLRTATYVKDELGLLEQPDSVFTLLESREVAGSMAYVIEVKGEATAGRFYDHDSILLVAMEANSPMGGMMMSTFSDYQASQGVRMAHAIETDLSGVGMQTMTIKRVEINGDITPEKLAEMVK